MTNWVKDITIVILGVILGVMLWVVLVILMTKLLMEVIFMRKDVVNSLRCTVGPKWVWDIIIVILGVILRVVLIIGGD